MTDLDRNQQKWANLVSLLILIVFALFAGVNPHDRGGMKVILANLGSEPFDIAHGDRMARLLTAVVPPVTLAEVDSLDETVRDAGGFGLTGR